MTIINTEKNSRLFFGFSVKSLWPEPFPTGRIVQAKNRHITLAFLGSANPTHILEKIADIVLPSFTIGPQGFFEKCLLLPPYIKRCITWKAHFWANAQVIIYQKKLSFWLFEQGIIPKLTRVFTPHVTLARTPFSERNWQKAFYQTAFYIDSLCLYESQKELVYTPLWSHTFIPAFQKIDTSSKSAFIIRADNYQSLLRNSTLTLSYFYPELLLYLPKKISCSSLNEVLHQLHSIIGACKDTHDLSLQSIEAPVPPVQKDNYFEWQLHINQ